MNTKRQPYDLTGILKHDVQSVPETDESHLDGMRVFYEVEPDDTIIVYSNPVAAEAALMSVRSAQVFELLMSNPSKRIVLVLQEGDN